ncbi:hypothetical protein [Mycoplasmopsis cynos]|uniref:hypothetical protein n=1 Tax=Mycoplasmopsis cynos TaxID=171284 RepID=UPI0022028435|nr:hypothetical protein [Mycoplasmopsis cynos]UWV82013.1 hypothetical protein NW065_02950 [Mycoplasmopsis cynos]
MNSPHDFILIVQPTRGLDVGAIHNIHEQILKEKQNGKAYLTYFIWIRWSFKFTCR